MKLPLVQKMWFFWRREKILKSHNEIASFWDAIIEDYSNGKIDNTNKVYPKIELGDKIIWQYWSQGWDASLIPEVVRVCMISVDSNRKDYQVLRLCDATIKDYIDLPAFVWEKKNDGTFSSALFSDLLRLALLSAYGGVWLDATILLTKPLALSFREMDYFVYQRDEDARNKKYWESTYAYYWGWNPKFKVRMLNSVIFSRKNSKVINTMFELLLFYWKSQKEVKDYFIFQILYNQLIDGVLKKYKCPIVSDIEPHLLQTKMNNGYKWLSYDQIIEICGIHKLTYKGQNIETELKEISEKINQLIEE